MRYRYGAKWPALGGVALCLTLTVAKGQVYNRPLYDTTTTPGVQVRASLGALAATGNSTPFWFRANQFGTVPWETPSAFATVGATGIWGNPAERRKPYLKASVEVVGNTNRSSRLILPEAYAALRLGRTELYVGRRKEINGLTDTLLTSGSVAWSGNALPITQVRIGTMGFAPLGFTNNFVAINAFYSHGWFADSDSMKNVMLHAKALFVRLGKPSANVHVYAGINHFVQWGGRSDYLKAGLANNGQIANTLRAYRYVVLPIGAIGLRDDSVTEIDTLNQLGNHVGSIDMGVELNREKSSWFLYYQHLFEDNSGVKFQNFPDGLWGVRWRNKADANQRKILLKQVTVEFLTTLNRSGTIPPMGNDDYFFNGQYLDGWVHKKYIIGTPVFTRTADIPLAIKKNSIWMDRGGRSVNNNAVNTIHAAGYWLINGKSSVVIMATANRYYDLEGPAKTYDQVYSSIEITNLFQAPAMGLSFDLKGALDFGQFWGDNAGIMFSIRKHGIL